MLKLTRRQMTASLDSDEAFAEWYVETFMREFLAEHYWLHNRVSLREMVLNGRSYARHFGLDDSPSQAGFITLMWQVGPNFYLFPGFRDVLARSDLTPAQKIDALYAVPEDQAVDAILGADSRYWYPQMVPQ